MGSRISDRLMNTLAELSGYYPDMRFGQLVEMVALLASEEAPLSPCEIDDSGLLHAAAEHIKDRRQRLKPDARPQPGRPLPGARAELLDVLEIARDRRRDQRFGRLVEQLAKAAGSTLYDVEDEQLMTAARGLTVDSSESAIRNR